MTVTRTGYSGLQRNLNEAQFQAQIGQALNSRSRTGGWQGGTQQQGSSSGGAQGNGGASTPVSTASPQTFATYAANAIPLLAPETRTLIEDAQAYDKSGNVDPAGSAQRWNAVQNAIARELRQMIPLPNPETEGSTQPATLQLSGEQQMKLVALSSLSAGSDPLARETREAFEYLDGEDRSYRLNSLTSGLDTMIETVENENDDENFIRRGWDALTGGAREDFLEFLKGKKKDLEDLDPDSATYAADFEKIMGDFQVKLQEHSEDIADSDGTWDTIGEVGRVVVAAAAGIIATAATGNVAIGFGASMLAYEAIDGAKDLGDAIDGKNIFADGHTGLISGGIAMGYEATFGDGLSGDEAKVYAKDAALDTISSVGTGGATFAGLRTTAAISGRLAAQGGWQALRNRILTTAAAGTAAQGVNSVAAVGSDATRMGFDGTFSGDALKDSAITQLKYTGLAIPSSAVAGAIPVFRTLPGAAASAKPTVAAGGTAAAAAAAGKTHRVLWTGVGLQYVNDVTSGFVGAQWVDGEVSKADAIAAFGGGIPGTLQTVAFMPGALDRFGAKGHGDRDTKWFSWSGYPPSRVELPRIAAEVVALRSLLLGSDGATKAFNDAAVPLSAVRSMLSKLAYTKANAKWERVIDLALQGDPKAIATAEKIEKGRGVHGVNRSATEKAADKARTPTDPSTSRVNEIKQLVDLGEAYKTARAKLPADQQALFPETLNLRTLIAPEDYLGKIQQDESIPADTRTLLQTFKPDAVLLRNSNVVEGLLTDPEFLINAIEALGPNLKPAEIDELRNIYNAQRLMEPNGAYTDLTQGTKWSDLAWETNPTRQGVYDTETTRLDDYGAQFLRDNDMGSPEANAQLKGIVDAWRAYVTLYSHTRSDIPVDLKAITDARATYRTAVAALPPGLRGGMPRADGNPSTTPDDMLVSLRGNGDVPEPIRTVLDGFNVNTHLLTNPGTVHTLLADPDVIAKRVDQFKADDKLSDAQFDSINLILDIENRLKAPASPGGGGGYNLKFGVPWNELTWRDAVDDTGALLTPGIFETETAKLSGQIPDFLATTPKNPDGTMTNTQVPLHLDAWKAYTELFSVAQHNLAKTQYQPGLDHKAAEQKPGSSAAPGHPYGFALKAGAYGVAVNLVVSWALKARPATHGFAQSALYTAYGLEAGLAFYNLFGQVGYMKALNAKTEFEATYKPAEYKPSDVPADMALFKPDLYRQYKGIESKRQFWNLVSDLGSLVSLLRNGAMGGAFTSLAVGAGSAALGGVAGMYFLNGALSGGWLLAQRTGIFNNRPKLRTFVRWASIIGGPTLQAAAVIIQTMLLADEIKKAQGPQDGSMADWIEDLIGDFIDEDFDVTELDEHSTPLPDRA